MMDDHGSSAGWKLGPVLRDARKQHKTTLRAAADAVGLDFTYLSKIETGANEPGEGAFRRLCILYRLDADALLLARDIARVRPDVRTAIERAAVEQGLGRERSAKER